MSKPFPDLRTDEEAEDWLQNAVLTEYDLSGMKKAPFELAPKDAAISLRLPAALLATLKMRAAEAHPSADRGAVGRRDGEAEGALAEAGGVGVGRRARRVGFDAKAKPG